MGEFPRRARQDAGIAGRAEAVRRLGCDLPNFAGGEDVFRLPARQRGKHVGGLAIEMDVDVRPFFGADLDDEADIEALVRKPVLSA